MIDARKFLLMSDYPMDKIIQFNTGNFTLAAFDSGVGTVAHGLAFAPLYMIRWSTSPTFEVSYDETGVTTNELEFSAQTDSTNMYIFASNLSASSVTFYYRAMFMMPSNLDLPALATEANDVFNFNTDYNYTKILLEGVTATGTQTITHNLGFKPQVEAWYVRASDGRLVHKLSNDVVSTDIPRVVTTTSELILTPGVTTVASIWYYKIYGDEL